MSHTDLLSAINIYSMFSFVDGRDEPGILINRYNIRLARVDYYFVHHANMQAYKKAFEAYDKETCLDLSKLVFPEDLQSIRPVSLSDFKSTMQSQDQPRGFVQSN